MRFLQSASVAVLLGLSAVGAAVPTASQAQIGVAVSVGFAPPPLPIYAQPPIPAYGYMWTPGYWAWNGDIGDYYWVPGTWIQPPRVGLLWTPGYWGWNAGRYAFNSGYWGPHVGFYGGVNYGFGYVGTGYAGGEWRGGQLYYNRSVNNISNVHVTNVYNRTVVVNNNARTSFNGGTGGIQARPTAAELAVPRAQRVSATSQQMRQVQVARTDPSLRASVNHGAPAIAATPRAGVLQGSGVVRASSASATYRPPANTGAAVNRPGARPDQTQRPNPQPGAAAPGARPAVTQHPNGQPGAGGATTATTRPAQTQQQQANRAQQAERTQQQQANRAQQAERTQQQQANRAQQVQRTQQQQANRAQQVQRTQQQANRPQQQANRPQGAEKPQPDKPQP